MVVNCKAALNKLIKIAASNAGWSFKFVKD